MARTERRRRRHGPRSRDSAAGADRRARESNGPRLRIGLTGATGFIGYYITEVAEEAGHEIVGFSRHPEEEVPGVVEMREFSQPEQADYGNLDAVIHLAGEPIFGLWTEEKKRRIFESRVEGTRALVRGIEKMRASERPKALVCASAVGFYGDTGDNVVDEDSDAGFGFLSEVVRNWEAAAREAADIGLRSVSVRIGFVLGEHGGALPLMRWIFRAYLGGRLGSGLQWMPWVHVRDVARAFVQAVEQEAFEGPVNAVAPKPVTNAEFTETLARVLDRPAVLPAPAFALKLAPGGMGELFLNSQRVDPAVLRLREFDWEFPELEAALRDALPEVDPGAGE